LDIGQGLRQPGDQRLRLLHDRRENDGADPRDARQGREHGGGEAEWPGQAKAALEQVGNGREVHRAEHRDEHEDQHLDHPHDEQDGEGGNEERHERGARQPTGGRLCVQR